LTEIPYRGTIEPSDKPIIAKTQHKINLQIEVTLQRSKFDGDSISRHDRTIRTADSGEHEAQNQSTISSHGGRSQILWEEIGSSGVDVEEDDFVMEAVVEEELEAIEKGIPEMEDLDEEEIIMKDVNERKPPTRIEITEAIDTLRLALGSVEASLELSHKLDGIQRYLQKQQMNENKKSPSIKSFFAKK